MEMVLILRIVGRGSGGKDCGGCGGGDSGDNDGSGGKGSGSSGSHGCESGAHEFIIGEKDYRKWLRTQRL